MWYAPCAEFAQLTGLSQTNSGTSSWPWGSSPRWASIRSTSPRSTVALLVADFLYHTHSTPAPSLLRRLSVLQILKFIHIHVHFHPHLSR
ncbi:hypothetical protein AB1N83_013907 [Pleurotus pulmonarius]